MSQHTESSNQQHASMLFTSQSLIFENKNFNVEQIPISIIDGKFGILNFKATKASQSQEEHEFIFTVDFNSNCVNITIWKIKNILLKSSAPYPA